MTRSSRQPAKRRDPDRVAPHVGTRVEAATLDPIARVLRAQRDHVLARWLVVAAARAFHRLRPEDAIADHIPRLYDGLVAVLEHAALPEQDAPAPAADPEVLTAAQPHADAPVQQGLAPAEVTTEFCLLRQEIWRALRQHVSGFVDARDLLTAELLINDGIDGAITTALAALEEHATERHRLQAELAAIVNSCDDAIIGWTLDETITSWNPAAERLYGYTADEAIGQPIRLIIPPDRSDELRAILECIGRGERVAPYETVRLRKDGSRVDVAVTVSPIREASGLIVGASAIARDIAERRRAERALRESEERFRTLADNMAQLAWMADPTGWIFWYNRRWFEYTGTPLEEMQGWGWTQVHHPDHVERVVARIQRAWDTGEPWEDTFPLRGKDGQYRWFLSRAVPIRDGQGRIVRWFGTNTDITELRGTEAALRRSEQERRGLLAAIAHDLKNPLASVRALAQGLRREADTGRLSPERLAARLGALVTSADRMAAQLDELTLVTRSEERDVRLDRRPTDLVALVREAAARQLGSEAHGIRVESDPHELVGPFDPMRLARVVDNLLANAVKYRRRGGEIIVQIHRAERAGRLQACLAVRDRGIGVPAADLPEVFERFRRGSNVGETAGSGVGLAAAREIVEAHGGTIAAESREGEGSTFTVWLPLTDQETRANH